MSTQLIGEVRAPIPAQPGKPLRYDTEYQRNGTANIFMAFEPLRGQRMTKVTEQRTKIDWAHFIQELIDQHYPHVEKIRLVMGHFSFPIPVMQPFAGWLFLGQGLELL